MESHNMAGHTMASQTLNSNAHLEPEKSQNLISQANSSLLMMARSKSHSKAPQEGGALYASTQYYLQHGSQLLNKSLKGQVPIRVSSSTMASRKQRIHLMEARKRN